LGPRRSLDYHGVSKQLGLYCVEVTTRDDRDTDGKKSFFFKKGARFTQNLGAILEQLIVEL